MSDYRRWYREGGTYFFTVVTQQRTPIFANNFARTLLGDSLRKVAADRPFETVATVLLPAHLHAIWNMPPGDRDFSRRWQAIKANFTIKWLRAGGEEAPTSNHRLRRGSKGVWQRRFWEHLIRDEQDLETHFDYIHYNPVKHGLVDNPWDWEASTFRKYVNSGHYPQDWGRTEPVNIHSMHLE